MASFASTLSELGWRPFFSVQLTADEEQSCLPVRVLAAHRGQIAVAGDRFERIVSPHIPGATGEEDHASVGDWLLIDRGTCAPVRVLERESLFKRRAAGSERKLQLIAANVDTLFIVASCNKDFNLARLERYLVLAREVGVTPVIVLTKIDLATEPAAFADAARTLQAGLVLELVNGREPDSVASLAAWCGQGQTVALVGSSGVGKSTLVNSLRGSDRLATQGVRAGDDRGRHTTTVREMHRLEQGGWLLDTPGMRELQLTDAASGLADVFSDILALSLDCRFSNCAHDHEPDCAVQGAIAKGVLDQARLERWRGLVEEEALNSAGKASTGRPTPRKGRKA